MSDFLSWNQRSHAKEWLLFPENLGTHLSIDETSLSHGELYTILTNKAAKGLKGSIVAIVAGTKVDVVINVLQELPEKKRKKVQEITLDMAPNMEQIAKRCFPKASRVTDRFHVQRLAIDALQDIRIQHRWEAIDKENEAIEQAKSSGTDYQVPILSNGDTLRQLLARSRYLLYKKEKSWTESQQQRAKILFDIYPDLKIAYDLTNQLSQIFTKSPDKIWGLTRLAKWHEKVRQMGFKTFNSVAKSIENHYQTILNYFDNRSTNAAAESFNGKIKAFRAQFRGVKNTEFFLYRLAQLYA